MNTGVFKIPAIVRLYQIQTPLRSSLWYFWLYDLRTNMPSFGKTNPLKVEDFADFVKAYEAEDREAVKDERWQKFSREEIAAKGNSLDIGLIKDDSIIDYEDLPDPGDSAREAAQELMEAVRLLQSVAEELEALK